MINDLIAALAILALASTAAAAILKERIVTDQDEWAAAVHDMTEQDRHTTQTEIRMTQGMCGGPEDADR